jgi:hypothetical protein
MARSGPAMLVFAAAAAGRTLIMSAIDAGHSRSVIYKGSHTAWALLGPREMSDLNPQGGSTGHRSACCCPVAFYEYTRMRMVSGTAAVMIAKPDKRQMRPTAGRSPQSWRHRHWRKYGQQRISSWNNRNVLACTEPWLRPKQQVVNHKQPTQNAVDDCPKYRMIFGVRNHLSFLHRSLSADLKLRIVAGSGVDRARRDSTVVGSRLLHLLVEAAGQGGVEGESHAG